MSFFFFFTFPTSDLFNNFRPNHRYKVFFICSVLSVWFSILIHLVLIISDNSDTEHKSLFLFSQDRTLLTNCALSTEINIASVAYQLNTGSCLPDAQSPRRL